MLLKTLNRLVSRITFIAKRKNRSLFPQLRNIALVLSSITLSFSLAVNAENQPSNDSGLSETGFKSYVAQLKKEAAGTAAKPQIIRPEQPQNYRCGRNSRKTGYE